MSTLPHDISDLHLAPVVLAVDARIESMGQLDVEALTNRVALESDMPDRLRGQREIALLRAVHHFIDCHGWSLSLDPRGIRLAHEGHTLVLGTPASFDDYLEGKQPKRPAGAVSS